MRADKRRHHRSVLGLVALAACGPHTSRLPPPSRSSLDDPWKPGITAQVAPYLHDEVITGLMVGIIDGDRQWAYGYGSAGNGSAAPTDKTLFELGAVTGVYTGVLLADAIERHEVELSTPVASLLPLGISVPTKNDVAITLEHLVTHRSGLPPLPPGMLTNPAPSYTEDRLFADLVRTRLTVVPGQVYSYSTYGLGLLGVALAHKAGATSWSAALEARVLVPLGMHDTVEAVPAGQSARHAVGHSDDGRVTAFSTFGALDAAGALRSTAADQLRFLRANLDAIEGRTRPLAAALRRAQDVIIPGTRDQIAMGWYVDNRGRRFANGATNGFHSYLEIDPDAHRAVVILAATDTSLVDQLGDAVMGVIEGEKPVPATFAPAEELIRYIGTFRFPGVDDAFVIELDGKKLIGTVGGQRFRLMPVGAARFYIEQLHVFASFAGEPANQLTLEVPGHPVTAERVTTPALNPTSPPMPTPPPAPPAAPAASHQ